MRYKFNDGDDGDDGGGGHNVTLGQTRILNYNYSILYCTRYLKIWPGTIISLGFFQSTYGHLHSQPKSQTRLNAAKRTNASSYDTIRFSPRIVNFPLKRVFVFKCIMTSGAISHHCLSRSHLYWIQFFLFVNCISLIHSWWWCWMCVCVCDVVSSSSSSYQSSKFVSD